MEKKIGAIQQGVPSVELTAALLAFFDGEFTQDYSMELASHLTTGENRQKKIASSINALILRNPLMPMLKARENEVRSLLRDKNSAPLLLTAIASATFPFAYDVVSLMGKYFHAQETIAKDLVRQKISAIYGSNRSTDIALLAIMPMLVDYGMVAMPKAGEYKAIYQSNYAPLALELYRESFRINNPSVVLTDDTDGYPYFEYIILS